MDCSNIKFRHIICYHQYQFVHLKMDDGIKMNLRTHRHKNYTIAESQHPEDFGYHRSSYSKEYVSPAFELNSAAKLMTKFVNSINKRCSSLILELREKTKNDELEEKAAIRQIQPVSQKQYEKEASMNNGPRKITGTRKDNKQDFHKKDKEKKQPIQQGASKQPKLQDNSDKFKGIKGTIQPSSLSFNPSDHNLYKVLGAQIGANRSGNQALNMEAVNRAILQQQSYVNNSQLFKSKEKEPAHNPEPRTNPVRNKLFGRSSYHVAIAYHIYLKKIYQSGGEINQIMMDPTHHAKKLRVEKEKEQIKE